MPNEKSYDQKKDAAAFALAGASLIAALLVIVNYITTPGTIWFIYPLFAVAWWPLSVYFCGNKRYAAFSIAGSALVIAFLAAVNLITSPQSLWFLFALPPVLCWPVSMCFKKQMSRIFISVLFSALLIAYCIMLNMLYTPTVFWAICPIYLILWWPLLIYYSAKREYKQLSIIGAVLTVAFLTFLNLQTTAYPWALYAVFPVLLWPISAYAGKNLGQLTYSVIGSICTVSWYGALNVFLAPESPWVIFIVYPLLWWPISVYFIGRGSARWYAAFMSAISIVFFAAVNLLYSPSVVWAIYPAYAMLWWPITLFFARCRKWFGYALTQSLLTIAFLTAVNLITSPAFPWAVFPSMCILWWPLTAFFAGKKKLFGFSVLGAALVITLLFTVNLITSPSFLWSLFPALCVLWWPVSVFFAKRKQPLVFAAVGSILVIALLVSVNLLTSRGFLWFVFPVFGVLWWPLGVFFHSASRNKQACQKSIT